MLTHLVIFRSAMVRQMYDLPDAFRAMPRDFVRISEPGSPEPGPNEATTGDLRQWPGGGVTRTGRNAVC